MKLTRDLCAQRVRIKQQWFVATILLGLLFFCSSAIAQASALWPGEVSMTAAGYPAVVKFVKGDPNKPLIVFIPGAHHTARVAYGHEGSHKQDFIEFWLHKQGYNFLAITYPIETKSGLMKETHPTFTIQDWGKQAAIITHEIIKDNELSGNVILIGWSMAGKVAQPFGAAAKEIGLDVDFFISFAATPPVIGIVGMNKKIDMAPSGLADRSKDIPKWYAQTKSNESLNGDREIIPWPIFESEYVGNIPVQLQGYGLRYKKGEKEFSRNFWEEVEEAKPYDFQNFPLVAMIMPGSAVDGRHAMTDSSAWAVFIANKIMRDYCKGVDLKKLPEEKFRSLVNLIRTAPQQLSTEVYKGNHFFYVGESGAREAVVQVMVLEEKVHAMKSELSSLLGVDIK